MRVVNHNWSATKQRLHPQSVAEISRHLVLSLTGFDNVGHRLGLTTRTQISVCKSPFPSAGTAVSGLANCNVWRFSPPACQWQPSFVGWRFNVGEHWKPWERCSMEGTRDEAHGRVQLHIDLTCVSRAWSDWGAVLCCCITKRQSRWPQSVGAGAPGGTG